MKRGFLSLRPALLPSTQGVLFTLAVTSFAALLSLATAPLMTHLFPFTFFWLAVAVSAWFGGFRQGVLSLVPALFFVHFLLRPLWGTPQGLLRGSLWLACAGGS